MKSIKKFLYIGLVAICALGGPALVLVYHYYLAPTLGTVDVVKAMSDIERGAIIRSEHVATKKVKIEELVEGAYQDEKLVVGQEARFLIKRGQQILPDMVDSEGLYPNLDEWNTSLPDQWIYSSPGSLLRGDRVSLYAVEVKDNELKVEGNDSVPGFSQDILNQINSGAGSAEKTTDQERLMEQVNKLKGIKVIDDLVVSYAKASNNTEVMSPEENRLRPTAPVTAIEVIVNQEQWDQIVQYPLQGYKFIVMYR